MMKSIVSAFILLFLVGLSAPLHAQVPAGGGVVIVGNSPSGVSRANKRPQGFSSAIPPLLLKAHTVFVSNAGSDAGLYPHPFSGTQDRAYGYFCDKLDDIDHFQRVDLPSDADLVLEVSMQAPPGSVSGNKISGTGDALPTFKLVVYDRPSHYILWTVSQTVDIARLQKTHDKNFDIAIDDVLKQFTAAATGTPIDPPKATTDTPAK